jgi:hypothetical protein
VRSTLIHERSTGALSMPPGNPASACASNSSSSIFKGDPNTGNGRAVYRKSCARWQARY